MKYFWEKIAITMCVAIRQLSADLRSRARVHGGRLDREWRAEAREHVTILAMSARNT